MRHHDQSILKVLAEAKKEAVKALNESMPPGEHYMNDQEESVQLYEHFFNIEHSDTWSLNDLLQYALELIVSDDEDCFPTDVSKDLCFTREHMLDEINNAIIEQEKNNKMPPMPVVASQISCLGAFLKEDELSKLEKLLNGDYGGKRGKKHDVEVTRRDDIDRMLKHRDLRTTLTHEEANFRLAQQEKIHERSAGRAIKRGQGYFREDLSSISNEGALESLDILYSLRRKMIKNEIQRLLSSSDESTRKDYKSDEHLNKIIKDFYEELHRDT